MAVTYPLSAYRTICFKDDCFVQWNCLNPDWGSVGYLFAFESSWKRRIELHVGLRCIFLLSKRWRWLDFNLKKTKICRTPMFVPMYFQKFLWATVLSAEKCGEKISKEFFQ